MGHMYAAILDALKVMSGRSHWPGMSEYTHVVCQMRSATLDTHDTRSSAKNVQLLDLLLMEGRSAGFRYPSIMLWEMKEFVHQLPLAKTCPRRLTWNKGFWKIY